MQRVSCLPLLRRATVFNRLSSPKLVVRSSTNNNHRFLSTTTTNVNSNKRRIPFKSITASVLLTSSFYLYTSSVAQAEAASLVSVNTLTTDELKDKENRIAVQAKSTQELAMALFVYRLCALPFLVDLAPHVISLSEKLGLQAPVYWFVKHTFFRHFCGGETSEECISSMDKLAQSGINCILDLSIEADLHVDPNQDNGGKYERDEQNADVILKMLKTCITTAANSSASNPMVAVKITGLSPPELLLRLNGVMATLDQQFLTLQKDGLIHADAIAHIINTVLPPPCSDEQAAQRNKMIELLETNQTSLDVIEFRKLFNLQSCGRDIWWKTEETDTRKVLFTAEDLAAYDRMVNRVNEICQLSRDLKVGVMVDAEQSYFQDAIDHIALNLQRKFNQRSLENHEEQPTVFNTYQMYTKSSRGRLELDVELSKRENFTFAAKLVRGAYMVSERKRAEEMGYASPIHDTLEDTHASYNGGVQFLLNELKTYQEEHDNTSVTLHTSPIVFMVASHNRDSVILTIEEMEKAHILPRSGVVLFGQLYGMQDQISYTLGRHGYAIYKYLPYGKINEVIPYLLRRAQENSSVLGGVTIERQLMWQEVKDRLTGNTHQPEVTITTTTSDSV